MDQINPPFIPITINPVKFVERLPEFSGERKDLYSFISLVEKIIPMLAQYDDPSQLLLIDLIKSKIKGKAKEAIEINFQAQTWPEIKRVLINYFGEYESLEQLYDKLRSTVFKSNPLEFYNEIKNNLRSLNNKTVTDLGINFNSEQIAHNNMRTALNIFKEKLPEPLRTILACRDPETLEDAMNIIFTTGYANDTGHNTNRNKNPYFIGNRNHRSNQSIEANGIQDRFNHRTNNSGNNDFRRQNNYQRNQQYNYNRQNGLNYNFNNGQNYEQNYQRTNYSRNYRQQVPEPMDINMVYNAHNSKLPFPHNNFTNSVSNNCLCRENASNFRDFPITNDIGRSRNLQIGNQPIIANENSTTQNFHFLASPENYLI